MISNRRPQPSPRRQQRALEVRGQILVAGRLCFGRKGLYETLVEEIAGQAGIAKGTFYLYFKDKEDLIRAVAEAAFQELGTALEQAGRAARSWDERLVKIAEVYLKFFAEQPDRMRILHQLRGMLTFERPEWLPLRVCVEAHVELLGSLIFAPPKPMGLTRRRAVEIAGLLFGAVSGLVSVWASIKGDRGLRRFPRGIPRAARGFAASLARTARKTAPTAS